MKQRSFFTVLWLVCSLALSAQTQQGFVKTKGRLGNNEKVIHGTPLSGVMVTVKGRNSVVSGQDGKFSLVIPDNNYYLQSVQKKDFVLVDPDVLSKQFFKSKNQLVLVLENQAQQAAERRAVERKISSNLYAQLQKRSDELETLREQHKITEEKYREMLQQLNRDQDDNEKIIKDMVERYSKMDFDQIDEFNRRISDCIISGRLTEADSLLRRKGDINSRIRELNRHHNANEQKRTELKRSESAEKKNRNDIAQDCYSKYEIFKMQHQNDSAAYYIKLRAELDTTNVEWGNEAGLFFQDYLADYASAESFYQRSLHAAYDLPNGTMPTQEQLFECQNPDVARCWNNMGYLSETCGNYDKAILLYRMAIAIIQKIDSNNIEKVKFLTNLGVAYNKNGDYDDAEGAYSEAFRILKSSNTSNPDYGITLCNNWGTLNLKRNPQYAMSFFELARDLQIKYYGDTDPNLPKTYLNIAICKSGTKNNADGKTWVQDAFADLNKAEILGRKYWDEKHPFFASIYNIGGSIYQDIKNSVNAKKSYEKAISIARLNNDSHSLGIYYNNLADMYVNNGDINSGIAIYLKAKEELSSLLPPSHPYMGGVLSNIAIAYMKNGEYHQAIKYFEEAIPILTKDVTKGNTSEITSLLNTILYLGDSYLKIGDKGTAKEKYNMALQGALAVYPENHTNVIRIKELIQKINESNSSNQ